MTADQCATIENLVRHVLVPKAVPVWWETRVAILGNRTPRQAIDDGDFESVRRLAVSYIDSHLS